MVPRATPKVRARLCASISLTADLGLAFPNFRGLFPLFSAREVGQRGGPSYNGRALTKKPSRRRRRLLIGLGVLTAMVPALWLAIHHVPGFGPAVADGARAVLGPGFVAWAEDTAYGVEDQINRWRYSDAAPKTFWEAPPPSALPSLPAAVVTPAAAPSGSPTAEVTVAASTAILSPSPLLSPSPSSVASADAAAGPSDPGTFPPPSYSPPFQNVATPGDGVWIAMPSGGAPPPSGSADGAARAAPLMFKSLVHPDPKRSFAAVAIVAVDLGRVNLHLISGMLEPFSVTVPKERRQGLVAKDDLPDLIAAFNGGFKATHGHYGMMINGDTYVAPRDIACTIALLRDGAIRIRTWPAVKDQEGSMAAYRQTPPCLVEEGTLNANLSEYNKNWGATVSGETVIRRSAVGIDASGRTLFYGLGEAVTAQALGHAMKSAGSHSAAQLDVNYAYPRFLLFERASPTDPPQAGSPLIPGIDFDKLDYTVQASPRDFFYLTRRRTAS